MKMYEAVVRFDVATTERQDPRENGLFEVGYLGGILLNATEKEPNLVKHWQLVSWEPKK
jgi:hypothetical protein